MLSFSKWKIREQAHQAFAAALGSSSPCVPHVGCPSQQATAASRECHHRSLDSSHSSQHIPQGCGCRIDGLPQKQMGRQFITFMNFSVIFNSHQLPRGEERGQRGLSSSWRFSPFIYSRLGFGQVLSAKHTPTEGCLQRGEVKMAGLMEVLPRCPSPCRWIGQAQQDGALNY